MDWVLTGLSSAASGHALYQLHYAVAMHTINEPLAPTPKFACEQRQRLLLREERPPPLSLINYPANNRALSRPRDGGRREKSKLGHEGAIDTQKQTFAIRLRKKASSLSSRPAFLSVALTSGCEMAPNVAIFSQTLNVVSLHRGEKAISGWNAKRLVICFWWRCGFHRRDGKLEQGDKNNASTWCFGMYATGATCV